MTAAHWPATLPDVPEIAGYAEGEGDALLRTEMDAGPAQIRRRFTAAARPYQMPLTLTAAQLATLRAFWREQLRFGALAFWIRDPLDAGAQVLCRFTEQPSWNALAAGDGSAPGAKMFRTVVQLEILP